MNSNNNNHDQNRSLPSRMNVEITDMSAEESAALARRAINSSASSIVVIEEVSRRSPFHAKKAVVKKISEFKIDTAAEVSSASKPIYDSSDEEDNNDEDNSRRYNANDVDDDDDDDAFFDDEVKSKTEIVFVGSHGNRNEPRPLTNIMPMITNTPMTIVAKLSEFNASKTTPKNQMKAKKSTVSQNCIVA